MVKEILSVALQGKRSVGMAIFNIVVVLKVPSKLRTGAEPCLMDDL
jgi:hypothetical protein